VAYRCSIESTDHPINRIEELLPWNSGLPKINAGFDAKRKTRSIATDPKTSTKRFGGPLTRNTISLGSRRKAGFFPLLSITIAAEQCYPAR
jgi:hypothetical protein